jgi:acylphosphatase
MIGRLSGATLQGVQFRETIADIARKLKLRGQVKNSNDGDVEVLILYENKNEDLIKSCFEKTIKALTDKGLIIESEADDIRINKRLIKDFKVDDTYEDRKTEDEINRTNEFKIIREHELKEMTWALQGAGRVFMSSSKKIENVLELKKEEVIGRLNSVNKELLYAQSNIGNVDDLICLKHFIADPLIYFMEKEGEEGLIMQLIEFYYEFLRYIKNGKISDEDKKSIVAQIDNLQKKIESEIENRNKRG